jgi:hypothetical protein
MGPEVKEPSALKEPGSKSPRFFFGSCVYRKVEFEGSSLIKRAETGNTTPGLFLGIRGSKGPLGA